MRSALAHLETLRPRGLKDALAMMAQADRPVPIAGGTDLFVYLNAGTLDARRFLDLSALSGLRGIVAGSRDVTIGAATSFWAIRHHAAVLRRAPALVAAAAEIGGWQIQARATIGGNLANGSPAADSLPVLLAHDAMIRVRSQRGEREIPMSEMFTGYRALALAADELIVAVRLPNLSRDTRTFFRKVGTRRAQSISKVVFAGALRVDRRGRVTEARLAYGSMAATPVRARHAEAALSGQRAREAALSARDALASDLRPIDDIRSDADYRMTVAGNLLEQMLRTIR